MATSRLHRPRRSASASYRRYNNRLLEHLLTGATLGLAAAITPGPLFTLLVSETVRYGRGAGIRVALAPLATDAPILVVILWLLSHLSTTGRLLDAIALAGGVFLIWLGAGSLRLRSVEVGETQPDPKSFRKALAVNFLNAHVYVFWATVGAPLTLGAYAESLNAAACFIAGFYITICAAKMTLALLVDRSRAFLSGAAYLWTLRLLGTALIAFGIHMIWGAYRP